MASATLEKIDPEAYKPIVSLLFDPDGDKVQAIKELEELGRKAKSAMPALKVYYAQATNNNPAFGSRDAGSALHAMARIAPDDPAVIDTVLGIVSMPAIPGRGRGRWPLRELAIQLLPEVKTNNRKRVAVLMAALNDPSSRALAATELGKLGPDAKEALPILTKLKLDSDRRVREAVSAAINQIKE